MLWRTVLLCCMAVALASCSVRPVTEPPNLEPPAYEDLELINMSVGYRVTGRPGSIEPGSEIWALNLDGAAPPVMATVAGDGSFDVLTDALLGHELRLQVRQGERRSPVLDLVMGEAGPTVHALDCVQVSPPVELAFGEVAAGTTATLAVAVRNDCTAAVTLDSAGLRTAASALVVTPIAPGTIPVGDTIEIEVRFTPSGAGVIEEALLLQLSAPADRRAITVWGTGR